MEIEFPRHENIGCLNGVCLCLKALPSKSWSKVVEVSRKIMKLGKDDPRRIIHSLKVGLALTLVSTLYYFKPFYDSFGVNTMWAVLTVVVVFEFSVGATFGKGLNRMLATFVAGALGFAAHQLATLCGDTGEPILISIFVFVIGAIVSFIRFFPEMKTRFDYGMLIFILTFSLVSVSGYREDELLKMAHERISTIFIGCCIVILVSILIFPVWIGEDLHNLVAGNLEKLGNFLEGFGDEYFKVPEFGRSNDDKSFLQGYKCVLTSKSSEENMANLAWWEPGHGRFRCCHPWKQYLKIGNLARQCAYKIEALNTYLNSEIQTTADVRNKMQESCTEISSESGKALKEAASSINMMTQTNSTDSHITNSKAAAENLKSLVQTSLWEEVNLLDVMPASAVASLLLEVVEWTEKIVEAVHELGSLASFKSMGPEPRRAQVQAISSTNIAESHEITIGE